MFNAPSRYIFSFYIPDLVFFLFNLKYFFLPFFLIFLSFYAIQFNSTQFITILYYYPYIILIYIFYIIILYIKLIYLFMNKIKIK